METKLILIDDHLVVLEGLRLVLQGQQGLSVCGVFTNGEDAIAYLKEHEDIAIVFLDIHLPGKNGFEICKLIKKQFPAVKILILSSFYERSNIARMIHNGASGYLSKTAGATQLTEAITTVLSNKVYFSEEVQQSFFPSEKTTGSTYPKLTPRELEILSLIAAGKTTPQIAGVLFLSQLTVETHRKNMMHKLEVSNTASLIKRALDTGIL